MDDGRIPCVHGSCRGGAGTAGMDCGDRRYRRIAINYLRGDNFVVKAMKMSDERQLRIDLAAAFRIAAKLDWQEGVANHFSVTTSDDGRYFLMNPLWRHFSRVRASDLLLLDSKTDDVAL